MQFDLMSEPEVKVLLTPEQRRARKAERREQQRRANVGRAAKMHAARLSAEADAQQMLLLPAQSSAKTNQPPRFNIGCSGWFYWDWKDRFYPEGLPTKDWFAYYATQFDTVELNAPFYSWPTVNTVQTWKRQAENTPLFYTVKACELITHVKQFARTQQLVKDFYFVDTFLQGHMGCFLFQLPPSFHYSPARLKRILDQLDPAHRNVVEFRHASWWNNETKRAFKRTNTIFCSISAPRLPDELVQTSDEIYVRFHGTQRWYRHDYTSEELAIWTKRISDHDPKRTWAYFNNDFGGNAIGNARELIRQLTES